MLGQIEYIRSNLHLFVMTVLLGKKIRSSRSVFNSAFQAIQPQLILGSISSGRDQRSMTKTTSATKPNEMTMLPFNT
jgi:hypothetical protein